MAVETLMSRGELQALCEQLHDIIRATTPENVIEQTKKAWALKADCLSAMHPKSAAGFIGGIYCPMCRVFNPYNKCKNERLGACPLMDNPDRPETCAVEWQDLFEGMDYYVEHPYEQYFPQAELDALVARINAL